MDKKIENNIKERIRELKEICEENHIPMMVAVASETEKETNYIKEVVTPLKCNVKLTNDCITPSLLMFDKRFKLFPVMDN